MKILGFNASPHKNGNTAWMVNAILEGAREKGAETSVWHTGDLDIKPCQGCLGCVQGNGCVIKDDMQALYEQLKPADALVLGSPIYMGQMNAQARIFNDRLFAQITPRFSPTFKEKNAGKKLVLAFTQGNPDPGMFQAYFDYAKHIFQLLEFEVKDVVVIAGTRSEAASEKKGLLASMHAVGAALAAK